MCYFFRHRDIWSRCVNETQGIQGVLRVKNSHHIWGDSAQAGRTCPQWKGHITECYASVYSGYVSIRAINEYTKYPFIGL